MHCKPRSKRLVRLERSCEMTCIARMVRAAVDRTRTLMTRPSRSSVRDCWRPLIGAISAKRPDRMAMSAPLSASPIRSVLSRDLLTIERPSGEYAMLVTNPLWPRRTTSSAPVSASHTLTVLSQDPLTIRRPSGEYATLVTSPSWPRNTANSSPLVASHMRTTLSLESENEPEPLTIRSPSGE